MVSGVLLVALSISGCNLNPAAMLGDVNAPSLSDDTSRSSACSTRNVAQRTVSSGNGQGRSPDIQDLSITSGFSSVSVSFQRSSAQTERFRILYFKVHPKYRSSGSSLIDGQCRDANSSTETRQDISCSFSTSSLSFLSFHSMEVANELTGARTLFHLNPEDCPIDDWYSVYLNNSYLSL